MADVFVTVPFVPQDELFYCGPATGQMVLSALGIGSPPKPPRWQDRLWDFVINNTGATRPSGAPSTPTSPPFPQQKCEWCVGHWTCWSTTPGVLESLLNTSQGVAHYGVTTHTTEASATDTLLDAIDANLPAVALVYGWQHWLVVDGYSPGAATAWAVGGRTIAGIYIRDPWDVAATHYISTRSWRRSYLKFVPCGSYGNKFVVLSAVRLPPPQVTQPPVAPTNVRILPLERPPLRPAMKTLMPISFALQKAGEVAAQLGGADRLRVALAEARPSSAVLVQRLDEPDSYYYIVSFLEGDRETARVTIDAEDGELLEVSGVSEKGQVLQPYVTPAATLDRLYGEADRMPTANRFQIRPGVVGQHPVLVWKPCGQSSSPFLPFYQFSVGDTFVYYRLDGRRFDELTEGPA